MLVYIGAGARFRFAERALDFSFFLNDSRVKRGDGREAPKTILQGLKQHSLQIRDYKDIKKAASVIIG